MRSRRMMILYSGVVGLGALIVVWWVVFFTIQGDLLIERAEKAGAVLTAPQEQAVREAAARTSRMFLFEGIFLILLLLGGVVFILRAMRREVLLHRQQRDLLSAVTHELKSPIASARLYVQSLALGRVSTEEKRARYLKHAEEDLDRLGEMVERLLESARVQTGRAKLALEDMDLAAFARRTVPDLTDGRGIEVELIADEATPVHADPSALETILRNLIANAVKYGGKPPRLQVHVARADGNGVLEVRDFGPGVQGPGVDHVFEAFERGESELVKSQPGVGLGLYLVRELARALGGEARARNVQEPGGGFAVQVSLPLSPSSHA